MSGIFGRPEPPVPPPVVTPPTGPVRRPMHIVVHGLIPGSAISGVIGRPNWHAVGTALTYYMLEFIPPEKDDQGNVLDFPYGQPVSVHIEATGMAALDVEIPFAPDANVEVKPLYTAMPKLITRGAFLYKENGDPVFLMGASAFNALGREMAEGASSVHSIYAQRSDLGLDIQRVWTGYNIPLIGRLVPREHPDFYKRVAAHTDLAATHRQYLEWTGFTGPYNGIFDSPMEMIEHDYRMVEALAPFAGRVIYDRRNEYNNAPNIGVPDDQFVAPPADMLWSAGSGIIDSVPREPFGPIITVHPANHGWQRKVGHNAAYDFGEAGVKYVDETVRIEAAGEHDMQEIFDAYQGAAFFIAAANIHSPSGKTFDYYQGVELDAVQHAVAGARSVPLKYRLGTYWHGEAEKKLEGPGIIRAYTKTLPDGDSKTILIHGTDDER